MYPYKYDVFLSYAHLDNEPASTEEAEGWISTFHTALADQWWGRDSGHLLRIWRDTLLTAGDKATEHRLRETIRRALAECALLVIVLSPRFVARGWLKRELEWFLEAAEDEEDLRLARQERVLLIELSPTDFEARLDDLEGFLAYRFFTSPEKSLAGGDSQYREKVEGLVIEIIRKLHRLEGKDFEEQIRGVLANVALAERNGEPVDSGTVLSGTFCGRDLTPAALKKAMDEELIVEERLDTGRIVLGVTTDCEKLRAAYPMLKDFDDLWVQRWLAKLADQLEAQLRD